MKLARILVVDDDKDVLQFLTRLLQRAGYTVLTAQDAMQAVMQAQRQAPAPRRWRRPVPTGPGASAPPLVVSRDM